MVPVEIRQNRCHVLTLLLAWTDRNCQGFFVPRECPGGRSALVKGEAIALQPPAADLLRHDTKQDAVGWHRPTTPQPRQIGVVFLQ